MSRTLGSTSLRVLAYLSEQPHPVTTQQVIQALADVNDVTVKSTLYRLNERGLTDSPAHGLWRAIPSIDVSDEVALLHRHYQAAMRFLGEVDVARRTNGGEWRRAFPDRHVIAMRYALGMVG